MNFIYGKIIGGFLGSLFGPWGFIIGVIAGHFFDKGLMLNIQYYQPDPQIARRVFFKATFLIMGYIAKSDGRVSEQEIQAARRIMEEFNLRPHQKLMAIQFFNQGKSTLFNWMAVVDNVVRNCGNNPQLLQLFLEMQLKVARVDGIQEPQKRQILEHLCDKLNIPRSVLTQMEFHEQAEYVFREPRRRQVDEVGLSYSLLGITASATDQEVKKAYRQLMSQHHPDKLAAKGLPPGMVKMATEKTQRIQKAYTIVCQARGMK